MGSRRVEPVPPLSDSSPWTEFRQRARAAGQRSTTAVRRALTAIYAVTQHSPDRRRATLTGAIRRPAPGAHARCPPLTFDPAPRPAQPESPRHADPPLPPSQPPERRRHSRGPPRGPQHRPPTPRRPARATARRRRRRPARRSRPAPRVARAHVGAELQDGRRASVRPSPARTVASARGPRWVDPAARAVPAPGMPAGAIPGTARTARSSGSSRRSSVACTATPSAPRTVTPTRGTACATVTTRPGATTNPVATRAPSPTATTAGPAGPAPPPVACAIAEATSTAGAHSDRAPAARHGAGPDDLRTTRPGSMSSVRRPRRPSTRSRRSSSASAPIRSSGWSTDVSDMWCSAARNVLS